MIVTRYLLLAALLSTSLAAQETYPATDGAVGTPYSFNFGEGFESIPAGSVDGVEFGFGFTVASGTPPPGLALSTNGLLSGIPTTPGLFNFSIRLTFIIKIDGQDFCALLGPEVCNSVFSVPIRITGLAGEPFRAFPESFSFTGSQTGSAPPAQSVTLSNRSAQTATFTSQVTYVNGSNWLQLSAASGSLPAYTDSSIALSVTPGTLAPGVYRARVQLTPTAGKPVTLFIVLTIASGQPSMILSQNGLFFSAVQNGVGVPTQFVNVQSSTGTALTPTATPSTFGGGSGWLAVTAGAGTVDVRVTPGSLAPGDYYGQVLVSAQGVSNSPQTISVVMHIDPSSTIGATVRPSGLIFAGRPGGTNPNNQSITITNFGRQAFRAGAAINFLGGTKVFLTATPAALTVDPGATAAFTIRPNLTGLTAGIYRAEVTVLVEGIVETLFRTDVLLIVAPGAGPAAIKQISRNEATGCTPTKLIPVFTALGSGFKVTTGWPTPIEIRVVDDCGDPLPAAGTVTASFSNNDPALALQSLRDGRWTGTWQARGSTTGVVVTATATLQTPKLVGAAQIGGSAAANPNVPIISSGGAVLTPLADAGAPVALGGFMSIYGTKLANVTTAASTLPLPSLLGETQVIIGGRAVPVQYSSEGQINVIVPYDLAPNTPHQVIVRKGSTISTPETVTIATAQPGIFTANGKAIAVVTRDGQELIIGIHARARVGDVLVVYCTGLGPVNVALAAGAAATADPLPVTSNPVTVKIDNIDATVSYAGLTPGFPGLYQVNVQVPPGVSLNKDVPIVVTVAGQSSTTAVPLSIE